MRSRLSETLGCSISPDAATALAMNEQATSFKSGQTVYNAVYGKRDDHLAQGLYHHLCATTNQAHNPPRANEVSMTSAAISFIFCRTALFFI